jgi:hypothetical protein
MHVRVVKRVRAKCGNIRRTGGQNANKASAVLKRNLAIAGRNKGDRGTGNLAMPNLARSAVSFLASTPPMNDQGLTSATAGRSDTANCGISSLVATGAVVSASYALVGPKINSDLVLNA